MLRINKDTKVVKKNDIYDATTWLPGDIIVAKYSYSMIIVRFYKVISNKGRTITVRELAQKITKGNALQGECVPVDKFEPGSEEQKVRIKKNNHLMIDNRYFCHLYNENETVYFDHLD